MLENGFLLDGRFEILKKIGEGGTSTVYLAMNQKLNQQWVIKEIKTPRDSEVTRRVLQEARMMMNFDDPAIPRIVDIIESREDIYIVMDYISGQSLAHALRTKGPQRQEVVEDWAKQICRVLIYLHSLDPPIVYHDLKPGNIILKEPEHYLKLIDFGEARPCINGNAPGGGRTSEYAAPEQQRECRGNTDERTDIYCFGTTIYRLLTGSFPPQAPEPVGSVREAFPGLQISKGLDNIIQKCTQISPEKRFQSAAELMKALENVELWDEDYIRRLQRRVREFMAAALACMLLFFAGVFMNRAADSANRQDYECLIHTETSLVHEEKIFNYLRAMELDGGNPQAYKMLLRAYEDNGVFSDAESQQLSAVYNAHKKEFQMDTEEMLDLNYEIGKMYFHMYSGEGGAFRPRILKARSYFSYVAEYGTEDYKNYLMASSYHTLCDFFIQYVLSDSSIREPMKEEYASMLTSMKDCLKDMQKYGEGDAAYVRLTMYSRILDMLNVNMKGMALTGIFREELEETLVLIEQSAEKENVTRNISLAAKEKIREQIVNVRDNADREYENLKRGQ